MNNQVKKQAAKNQAAVNADTKKAASIAVLFAVSAAIILAGVGLMVYTIANNISLNILNSEVPGAVFGAVIAFLGVRYFLSVRKLKEEIYKTSSKFSWNNFRKAGAQKALSRTK